MTEHETKKGRAPRKEESKKRRRRREGIGIEGSLRLHVPEEAKDPNFHYHWLTDKPGRIQAKTVNDDYDIVTEQELQARLDKKDYTAGDKDTQAMRAVGYGENGQWMNAYLCKKPKEFYDEDKAKEQEDIAEAMKATKEGLPGGSDGLGTADHVYTPEDRVNVIS